MKFLHLHLQPYQLFFQCVLLQKTRHFKNSFKEMFFFFYWKYLSTHHLYKIYSFCNYNLWWLVPGNILADAKILTRTMRSHAVHFTYFNLIWKEWNHGSISITPRVCVCVFGWGGWNVTCAITVCPKLFHCLGNI